MEEDLLAELKSLISTMLTDLRPHHVPLSQTTLQLLFPLAVAAGILLLVVLLIIQVISSLRRKKRRKQQLGQFSQILAAVEEILGCPGGSAGPDGTPGSQPDKAKTAMQGGESASVESQPDKAQAGNLVRRCLALSERIDWHTNRPDNAKLVAMLSYRIALKTRMCPEQAALCFCCALVADAGMLDLPRQLFFREILTGKERKLLRDQCKAFIYQLDFVPRSYLRFFVDTCSCRKENMNGSGYPEGLKGGEIPVLARIVRAAEDFTAMTERRAQKYLVPLTRKAAVKEMRKSDELYDPRIVNIIEKIVLPPA